MEDKQICWLESNVMGGWGHNILAELIAVTMLINFAIAAPKLHIGLKYLYLKVSLI